MITTGTLLLMLSAAVGRYISEVPMCRFTHAATQKTNKQTNMV